MIKKILFKISGSFESGFGHIRRSVTLASELNKLLDVDKIGFLCDCSDIHISDLLSQYKCVLKRQSNEEILEYVSTNNFSTLVIDDPSDNTELCKQLKRYLPDIEVVCLDYFNYSSPFVDTIINLFNHNNDVSVPEKKFAGKYYEGLKYAIIRDNFMPYIGRNKQILPEPKKVLITFGGADTAGNTIKALRFLEDTGYSGRVDVVAGLFFRHVNELKEFSTGKKFGCFVHHNIDNLEEYIYEADFAFIGPGTTMMESCSVGIPVVVFPESERAYRFARTLETVNAIKLVNYKNQDLSGVKDIFNDYEQKARMSTSARKLIDGKGKIRISNIILNKTS